MAEPEQPQVRIQILIPILFLIPFQAEGKDHPPFRLGVNFQAVSAGFELQPLFSGENTLKFRPAQSNYVGPIAGWRWIAGSYGFKIGASQEIRSVEGESQYRDIRLSYYLSNLGAEASYTRYVGYLIDNSSTLSSSTLGGQTYYKLPDLETLGYGLNFFFVPNAGKYNLAAALDQSEIQEESGGAWLLMATWRYQKIQSNSPWIPAEKRPLFGVDQDVRYAVTGFAALGGGYGVNWIPSDIYFLSAMVNLTLGYQSVAYITDVEEQRRSSLGINGHIRIVTGVNVDEFIFTLGGYIDYFNSTTQSIKISPTVSGGVLTGVVRF